MSPAKCSAGHLLVGHRAPGANATSGLPAASGARERTQRASRRRREGGQLRDGLAHVPRRAPARAPRSARSAREARVQVHLAADQQQLSSSRPCESGASVGARSVWKRRLLRITPWASMMVS